MPSASFSYRRYEEHRRSLSEVPVVDLRFCKALPRWHIHSSVLLGEWPIPLCSRFVSYSEAWTTVSRARTVNILFIALTSCPKAAVEVSVSPVDWIVDWRAVFYSVDADSEIRLRYASTVAICRSRVTIQYCSDGCVEKRVGAIVVQCRDHIGLAVLRPRMTFIIVSYVLSADEIKAQKELWR